MDMSILFSHEVLGKGTKVSDHIAEYHENVIEEICASIVVLNSYHVHEFYVYQNNICYIGNLDQTYGLLSIDLLNIKLHTPNMNDFMNRVYDEFDILFEIVRKDECLTATMSNSDIIQCGALLELDNIDDDYFFLKEDACFLCKYSENSLLPSNPITNKIVTTFHRIGNPTMVIKNHGEHSTNLYKNFRSFIKMSAIIARAFL